MSNRLKNIIYSVLLILAVFLVYQYRKHQTPAPVTISGETMGTTYHITYFDEKQRNFKTSVDSLLVEVNKAINNYDPESEVSRFNANSLSLKIESPYFLPPVKVAAQVHEASGGAFDPTVMPLVNSWGFGPGRIQKMDTSKVDSIKAFVGFEKINFSNGSIWKSDPRVQLDFGGIGQGYGADVITGFLQSKGITNMLVELGGEGMAVGVNLKSGKPWEIGILDPASTRDNQFFKAKVSLTGKSFTTSGNYFNYREVDGKRYSHTIDPDTGFPVQRALLSASVFSPDAATADAWGTAFMVMGHEKAIDILNESPGIDAFLIYTGDDGKIQTYATPGIQSYLTLFDSPSAP